MIELGQKVRDRVTGFEGIGTNRSEFLNGCVQIGVKPEVDKDGKMREAEWFDVEQLDVIGDGVMLRRRETGGPQPDTPSTRYRG